MPHPDEPTAELRRRDLLLPLAHLEGVSDLPRALFARRALERPAVAAARIEREGRALRLADLESLAAAAVVKASLDERGVDEALLCLQGGSAALVCRDHDAAHTVSVAGAKPAEALEEAEGIASALRLESERTDPRVPVAFWSGADASMLSEATARWRRLELPRFREIEANYPRAVRLELSRLIAHGGGSELAGRLALWHGEPGTGKTWALRALGREWAGWCELHYVTDPERLLGGDSAYMLKALAGDHEDDEGGLPRRGPRGRRERWRLLVLEDAGELLGIEAPAEVGRGFARLLNIVDGMLGQGTRALVLVTTNEPLGKLHPAVLRPGRAMAQVEFGRLSAEEASSWLRAQGVEREVGAPATIAELHAVAAGGEHRAAAPVPVGFT